MPKIAPPNIIKSQSLYLRASSFLPLKQDNTILAIPLEANATISQHWDVLRGITSLAVNCARLAAEAWISAIAAIIVVTITPTPPKFSLSHADENKMAAMATAIIRA